MEFLKAFSDFFNVQGFLLSCLVFIPLERLLSLRSDQRILRRLWRNDLFYVFFNRIWIVGALGMLVVAVMSLTRWLVPESFQEAVAAQPFALQLIEIIILSDIGFYTAHRMFHDVPWLWPFHAVHHSIEELDWLAAARVHPIDQIITKGMSVLPVYALGFSTQAVLIYSGIYFWHSMLLHSNVRLNFGPLRWLIASPEFHHWHHANHPEAYNRNYAGQLSVLDIMFGTIHLPRRQMPSKYGVDDPVPEGYFAQLMYPFKRRDHSGRITADSNESTQDATKESSPVLTPLTTVAREDVGQACVR